jgi:hypothetical protein
MLKKTFLHIDGISSNIELELWKRGVLDWENFIYFYENKREDLYFLSEKKLNRIYNEILFSIEKLNSNDLNFFKNKLISKEHYRLYNYGKVAFVDIETTGLSKYIDEITMIGIYDGQRSNIYISGINLEDAYSHLEKFDIIVSFNGKCFDIPFIEAKIGKKIDKIHLDLRYLLKEFNLSGGLKNIEKKLGLKRAEEIEDIDGFEAVRLWKRYKKGDLEALELLKKYNEEDIINLKFLIEWYLDNKKKLIFNDILIE